MSQSSRSSNPTSNVVPFVLAGLPFSVLLRYHNIPCMWCLKSTSPGKTGVPKVIDKSGSPGSQHGFMLSLEQQGIKTVATALCQSGGEMAWVFLNIGSVVLYNSTPD